MHLIQSEVIKNTNGLNKILHVLDSYWFSCKAYMSIWSVTLSSAEHHANVTLTTNFDLSIVGKTYLTQQNSCVPVNHLTIYSGKSSITHCTREDKVRYYYLRPFGLFKSWVQSSGVRSFSSEPYTLSWSFKWVNQYCVKSMYLSISHIDFSAVGDMRKCNSSLDQK